MRIYLKLLLIIALACPSLAWLPSTAKIMAEFPHREVRWAAPLLAEIRSLSSGVLGSELDELLTAGNLQEIIWRLREEGGGGQSGQCGGNAAAASGKQHGA